MRMVVAIIILLSLAVVGCTPSATEEEPTLLFVQESQSIKYDGNILSMVDVNPHTLYFSDRPQRIAGYWTLIEFMQEVGTGEDNFAENPPNATLVSLQGDEFIDVVLEIPNRPIYQDGALQFRVEVIEGELPDSAGQSALFIDTVGRPASPGSVAGVHRRHHRRESRHHR